MHIQIGVQGRSSPDGINVEVLGLLYVLHGIQQQHAKLTRLICSCFNVFQEVTFPPIGASCERLDVEVLAPCTQRGFSLSLVADSVDCQRLRIIVPVVSISLDIRIDRS